jgi:hypothetical protein
MKEWFSKPKTCSGRERLLSGVPTMYKQLLVMSDGEADEPTIDSAEASVLDMVAKTLALAIDREESLVNWIEEHDQTYPAEADKWYAICCAAGWVVIQTYFRERISRNGGE